MATRQNIAVMGLGLMGGSLGLALRALESPPRVTAYARREETRREAERLGVADAVFDTPADAVRGADIVVLCVPVLATVPLLEACLEALKPGAVVTDVGSTKEALVKRFGKVLDPARACYVGSHPIAGSEETGVQAARADLYAGATVVVTPGQTALPGAIRSVTALWEALGARVLSMPPDRHDRLVARTSHLPHLVSAALTAAVCRDDTDLAPLCGSGFRDTTRVAAGSETLWHDIVETNQAAIAQELGSFAATLRTLQAMVEAGDFEGLRAFLADCRRRRGDIVAPGSADA